LSRSSSLGFGDATVLKQTLGIALGTLCVTAVACSARQRLRMSEVELFEAGPLSLRHRHGEPGGPFHRRLEKLAP
jgi:hypothetical protein